MTANHSERLFGTWIRLRWIQRIIVPQVVTLYLMSIVISSAKNTDLDVWRELNWEVLWKAQFAEFDFDGFADNFSTINGVTRVIGGIVVVTLGGFCTDMMTSGRRLNNCLLSHPFQKNQFADVRFWAALLLLYALLTSAAMATHVRGYCSSHTSFKFFAATHVAMLVALLIANQNFSAFVLRLPELNRQKQQRQERAV